MRRFLFTTDVKKVEGTQIIRVDAETAEEALALVNAGRGEIYVEELCVMDVGPLRPDGETDLTDFGDFPPDPPKWVGGEITNAQLEHYLEACEKNHCQVLHVGWNQEIARLLLEARKEQEASRWMSINIPAELHPDTEKLVIDTAQAMAAKLVKAQEKYGYDNGWKVQDWSWNREECLSSLYQHLSKGDPLDCINYLAFMLANGWHTALPLGMNLPQPFDFLPVTYLSPESFDRAQQLLDAPAEPSQALIDLMGRPRRVQVQVPELTEQDKADRVLRVDVTMEPPKKSEHLQAAEKLAELTRDIADRQQGASDRLRQACQPRTAENYEDWLLRCVNNVVDFVASPGERIKKPSEQ